MASMNISLPDPLRDFVQSQIDSGQYASVSDYVRDLIRRDQTHAGDEEKWLRELDAAIERGSQDVEAGRLQDMDEAIGELDSELAARVAERRVK